MLLYILSGAIGVTNMILWGIYGDLLAEEFKVLKVMRSLAIGILWSLYLFIIDSNLPLFIVALSVISLERITTEIYKALVRKESQTKYSIPSDLNLRYNRGIKIVLASLLYLTLAFAVYYLDIGKANIYLALTMGLFVALGGMLKDAPFEGFSPSKFLRSPTIGIIIGFLVLNYFPTLNGKFYLLSIAGAERIVSECYKKIICGRIPGKFKTKLFNAAWQRKRRWILIPYSATIIILFLLSIL